jgi:hypothetical protein
MDKQEIQQNTPNYYSSYLRGVLRQQRNEKLFDQQFINERAEKASEEFENQRRSGVSVISAQELAMKVLLDGLDLA